MIKSTKEHQEEWQANERLFGFQKGCRSHRCVIRNQPHYAKIHTTKVLTNKRLLLAFRIWMSDIPKKKKNHQGHMIKLMWLTSLIWERHALGGYKV